MEATMSNRTIKHEVKLQPSVIIILGLLALGVCANAFAPVFTIKDALAGSAITSGYLDIYVKECSGCGG
jgi:hypothetical protein